MTDGAQAGGSPAGLPARSWGSWAAEANAFPLCLFDCRAVRPEGVFVCNLCILSL